MLYEGYHIAGTAEPQLSNPHLFGLECVQIGRNTTRYTSYAFAYTLIALFNAFTVGHNKIHQQAKQLCPANPRFLTLYLSSK